MSADNTKEIQAALQKAESALNRGDKGAAQDALSKAFELGKPNNMSRDQQREFQQLNKKAR